MKYYYKKQKQGMFPWKPCHPMDIVSVSEADKANGSPKDGDMIAQGDEEGDYWLISKEFFDKNYTLAE